MRFSVDAHTIGCHLTGNEVYIRNLLHQFARLDAAGEFIAYVSKSEAPAVVPNRIRTRLVSENPYKRLGWDLPARVRRDQPDLLHVQYTGPVFCRVPLVVSVHDVSFLEYPQWFTQYRAMQLRMTVARTVRKAAAVLTPSEFSRDSILRHYKIDGSKVIVTPNGVSAHFRQIDRSLALAAVERKLKARGPFVLTVGDLQPRKNHAGLLRAFESVMREHPQLQHRLVFVGKETWYSKDLHRAVDASSMRGRVHFAGFVDDRDLVQFYGACDLFVYPSFYEGFGLPILEAMACGRAVACSGTTAMPEVADSAGILFNPYSVPEMARAMRDVLLDPQLRVRLERLGAQRASLFSWERAASRTLQVYQRVAGSKQPVTEVAGARAI
ncbi:MAG: glycosyltransferase family 4 protein [Bryobacterales bacterium]|nr:glycosyltransferase family 4 protein [Bryobacterales bacterium]MBV9399024.1 glycosyltransferase family 4 protein [Bryobacterales bacterium]